MKRTVARCSSCDAPYEIAKGHACVGTLGKFAEVIEPQQSLRYNTGKPPLHLIAGAWQYEVAQVMGYGASKYARDNWRKGGPWTENLGSVLRHINQFQTGEDTDAESGRHHLAHALCGLFFVLEWSLQSKGTDDRYKG